MRSTTEDAALNIGELLISIVDVATSGNDELRESLARFVRAESGEAKDGESADAEDRTISEAIEHQSEMIEALVNRVEDCFSKQLELVRMANQTSRRIHDAAKQTAHLMKKSQVLAFNVQIEASRLGGEQGRAFAVLGEEMKSFSECVEEANHTIADSVAEFVEGMPKLEAETVSIAESLSEFSDEFRAEMTDVRRETQSISTLLSRVLESTESRNNDILKRSRDTLSYLQFQDPVAQGLKRAEHDIQKLVALFENRKVVDDNLADIVQDVGNDGQEEEHVDAGEVLLF
ncbi:methyl-accepting chemotaxis protein [Stieleria sp. JC731]|uniref:methyl-accepting chemotaxis protein n=1 Tax=Pirellulaceae TaxID=2691357 RepID=UPI001E52C952|nr:methyl-accepting chemotaxis protein [Stieleria sp. JC731]MCC9604005.1 methyl-accepting chemotaxis protein [Stieleria sp. JC731]